MGRGGSGEGPGEPPGPSTAGVAAPAGCTPLPRCRSPAPTNSPCRSRPAPLACRKTLSVPRCPPPQTGRPPGRAPARTRARPTPLAAPRVGAAWRVAEGAAGWAAMAAAAAARARAAGSSGCRARRPRAAGAGGGATPLASRLRNTLPLLLLAAVAIAVCWAQPGCRTTAVPGWPVHTPAFSFWRLSAADVALWRSPATCYAFGARRWRRWRRETRQEAPSSGLRARDAGRRNESVARLTKIQCIFSRALGEPPHPCPYPPPAGAAWHGVAAARARASLSTLVLLTSIR